MDIRVAIFEDNKLVRDALEAILNGTGGYSCVGTFSDGNNWDEKNHANFFGLCDSYPGNQRIIAHYQPNYRHLINR